MERGSPIFRGLNKPQFAGCCRNPRLLFFREGGQVIISRVEPKMGTVYISHRETAKAHLFIQIVVLMTSGLFVDLEKL